MQAVLDACRNGHLAMRPCLLVCNNRDAEALDRARHEGLPAIVLSATTHPDPTALDSAILDILVDHGASLIVLAGYMRRLGPRVLERFRNRILNIHPSLLPRHGGQGMFGRRVHEAVLAARDEQTGVTIHLVDEEYDHGTILAQTTVPVLPGDSVEALSKRVLAREHKFLIEVLGQISRGDISLPILA